ncbi:MAG: PASTA domain-containing protein [Bacteroidetes bacterium]|nr:MAG: PASTA domain-containing protein [Bacteroidota bacterium]
MDIKNEVLIRVYIVLAFICLVAMLVFGRTIQISIIEGEKWRQQGNEEHRRYQVIEAERGNILTEQGDLLATSLPFFDIAFDPTQASDNDWNLYADSLAYCLATYVNPEYTPGGWRYKIDQARADTVRFIPIKKNATLTEKEFIGSFPLFNLGRYHGGFIADQHYDRERPFGILADRTIGYVRERPGDTIYIGLEGKFDPVLRGEAGRELVYKVAGNYWMPVENLTKIEPKPGSDIVTTLDINIQDITENALLDAMIKHQAKRGCAIVMEVKTGAIRAIANIGARRNGKYWEIYNDAIGTATEPGSTYKLAAIMALLEDEYVDLEDSIDLEKGTTQFYEETLVDASAHGLDTTTVRRAFEVSSNVGIAKLVQKYYGEPHKADRFIKRLKQFYLNHKTGIEIEGEPKPYIKEAYSEEDDWSGTTLPWMSIGYEVTITPLQLLTFYNAVANDGRMMKPQLVREIQRYGETVKKFPAVRVKERIASEKTIRKAKELLEGVVENGTAKKYKSDRYRFAGKTGTAQKNYQKLEDKVTVGGYQASFVGYFPAENPKYSCIVVISEPQVGGYYGGSVALPVFREIADKTFATDVELFQVLNQSKKPVLDQKQLPDYDVGYRQDFQTALSYLKLPFETRTANEWSVIRATPSDSLKILKRTIPEDKVPNVVGMGIRDALYILENLGLKVEIRGYGRVKQQSIKPGTRVHGQTISLRLG